MERPPTYFALALASFLFAIVLLFNMLGPMAVPVTKEQFDQIKEADLIECLIEKPRGFAWQLKRTVRVQGPNGATQAKRIELAEPEPAMAEDWRQKGGTVRQERGDSWWGGAIFIALLLGVGGWHIWSQIRLDLKGGGGPRRRLRDLETALKQGKITQAEFQQRAERLWAEL